MTKETSQSMANIMFEAIESIKSIELNILSKTEELNLAERNLDLKLLTLKDEIANEVDEKGKPAFSNDMKRQAALMERKMDDNDISDMETFITDTRLEIAKLNIDLRYTKNQFDVSKLIYKGHITIE